MHTMKYKISALLFCAAANAALGFVTPELAFIEWLTEQAVGSDTIASLKASF